MLCASLRTQTTVLVLVRQRDEVSQPLIALLIGLAGLDCLSDLYALDPGSVRLKVPGNSEGPGATG
jgi:hypothetical protein